MSGCFNTFACALLLLLLTGACRSREAEYRSIDGVAWHTTYHIVYQGGVALEDSVLAVFPAVENSLSPFLPNSAISRINAGSDSVADALIVRVLTESQRIHRLSGGAFDPTVSPLINLWGFGYGGVPESAPSQRSIDSVMEFIGIDGVSVADGMTMRKPDPRMQFNFSAITKGYGCDLVAEVLRRNGVENFMVEIGGEIVASGVSPRGKAWRIQIDAPRDDDPAGHQRMRLITLDNAAVATSGNYRNYRDVDGYGRVGHTISTRTGRPVVTSTLSVSVVAGSCMEADALATAAMAMTADSAMRMFEATDGAEALIVTADGNGGYTTIQTAGFPR